jgi:hypothetical protein
LELVQRTDDFKELFVMNVSVESSGFQIGMTEKLFDGQQVNALLQQVSCKAMPEGVNCGGLGYAGFFLALLNDI